MPAKLLILNVFSLYFYKYSFYFNSTLLLLCFYFVSTNLLLILYCPSTNWLPYLDKQEALGTYYIPTVGMLCSQAGNIIFPVWEHFFHLMEIMNLARHLRTTPRLLPMCR